MIINKNKLIIFSILFLYFLMPNIILFTIPFNTTFYYLIPFVLYFFYLLYLKKIPIEFNLLLFLFIPFIWYSFVSLINFTIDKSILIQFILMLFSILSAISIANIITQRIELSQIGINLIKTIYLAGVLHAIIMILVFFIPWVRDTLYSFVFLGENGLLFVELNQRSSGLTSNGGDSLSIFQSTTLVFGIYYIFNYVKQISLLRLVIHLFFFVLLLFSILLSARTGLVLLFLGISLLFAFKLCSFLYSFSFSISTIKKGIFSLLLIFLSIVFTYNFFINSDYTRFSKRAFELFTTYEERGNIGTTSTDKLKEMYFLPKNDNQLIYGDGNFGRDSSLEFIESDVGYVRIWFGSGVIGVILFYLPIILIYLVLIKTIIKQKLFLPFTYVIIMLFVVNFKVLHLYSLTFGFKFFILLTSVIIYTNYFHKKKL